MRLVPCCQICAEPQDRGLTPISWLRLSSCTAVTTAYTASNSSAEDSWGGGKGREKSAGGTKIHLPAAPWSCRVFHEQPGIGWDSLRACLFYPSLPCLCLCLSLLLPNPFCSFPFLIKGGFFEHFGGSDQICWPGGMLLREPGIAWGNCS